MHIYEPRTLKNEAGVMLIQHCSIIGDAPPGFPEFVAPLMGQFQTPEGPRPFNAAVAVPGATIEEAFANAPKAMEDGLKKIEADLRKRANALIIPDGSVPPMIRSRMNGR